jgi:hypothetical protein
MDTWTLESMNEGTMTAIEITARIFAFSAVACIVFCVVSIAWLCLEESRRSTPRRTMLGPVCTAPATSSSLAGTFRQALRAAWRYHTVERQAPRMRSVG